MSKLWIALAVVLGTANLSFAQMGIGPAPGMRFGDAPQITTVRTGSIEGGDMAGAVEGPLVGPYGGACAACGGAGCGICVDWKLIGWYGSWNDGHHGCRRGCGFGY
jgi:hypothetical protein